MRPALIYAPNPKVHPRIYFGPEDVPAINRKLYDTEFGKKLCIYISTVTSILRFGRVWYDSLPTELKTMPDGTPSLSNVGLYDQSGIFSSLNTGDYSYIRDVYTTTPSRIGAFMGGMALECLSCLLLRGMAGTTERTYTATNVLDNFCLYLQTITSDKFNSFNFGICGGLNLTLCYDFIFHALSEAQAKRMRDQMRRMIPAKYDGVGIAPEGCLSNWISLNSHQILTVIAMDGDGAPTEYADLPASLTQMISSYFNFIVFGWNESGSPYEGLGKNSMNIPTMLALNRLGYIDILAQPSVRNYALNYLPRIIQPYGYATREYDVFSELALKDQAHDGPYMYDARDIIGFSYMFPTSPEVSWCYQQLIFTPNSKEPGKFFMDFREPKFLHRVPFYNDIVSLVCFGNACPFGLQKMNGDEWKNPIITEQVFRSQLSYLDQEGATAVGRTSFTPTAVSMQVHVRQNMGGHTVDDRGNFLLSGYGRSWAISQIFGTNQESKYHNTVRIEPSDPLVTQNDGAKMMIPAKLSGYAELKGAAGFFVGCDRTYCINNTWRWAPYTMNAIPTVMLVSNVETLCHNDFRIKEFQRNTKFMTTPFYKWPYFNNRISLPQPVGYGIYKEVNNQIIQSYRIMGFVKGVKEDAYALIMDDALKLETANTTYIWRMNIPNDLTMVAAIGDDVILNPDELVFMAPDLKLGLYMRIINADYVNYRLPQVVKDTTKDGVVRLRFELSTNGKAPRFMVLLYPFKFEERQYLPQITFNKSASPDSTLDIRLRYPDAAGQVDTYNFAPRQITIGDVQTTINEFTLFRNGNRLLDYRGKFEPILYR